MDTILCRRSVRKFDLEKKKEFNELKELCKYAEAAPSAKNQRSREYIIVDDKEIIDQLSLVARGTMLLSECNSLIVVVGKNPNTLERKEMQPQDLAAATENILLAATDRGIGSCWCGIYPMADRMLKAKEILKIEDGKFIFSIVALGYPVNEESFYDKEKFSDDLVYHNRG